MSKSYYGDTDPFSFVRIDATNTATALNLFSHDSTAEASATQNINVG